MDIASLIRQNAYRLTLKILGSQDLNTDEIREDAVALFSLCQVDNPLAKRMVLASKHGIILTEDQYIIVGDILRGSRIEAIKKLRGMVDIGLKEALDIIKDSDCFDQTG